MRALLLLAALCATSVAKESTFEAESSPLPRLASVSSPPPPPLPSPAALQPSRPSQTSATHPLTVLTEYQTFDEDVDAEGVRRAVSAALATLSRAVHLPGPEPLPLLLPRPCAVLQQWSSGNRNTKSGRSECIKARRCRSNASVLVAPDAAPHAQASPIKQTCLQAQHNVSLFEPVRVCTGKKPGDCISDGVATPVLADLVLYVTATSRQDSGMVFCGSTTLQPDGAPVSIMAAAGGACEVDERGRPVAGAINICPARAASLKNGSATARDGLVSDILHEMLHVLAFSEGLFPSFKNVTAIGPGGGGGLVVRSPAVLAVARAHFNCSSLAAVPLETEGGEGTRSTHWKMRALNGELMTGTVISGQRPVLSNFTLAFLDDTGHYVPQWSAAAPLSWGSGAGCSFVTADSCAGIDDAARARFFCTPPPQRGGSQTRDADARARCTHDRLAVGTCSRLPLTPAAESCFIVAPYSNWVCRDDSLNDADRKRWGYSFSPSSRCIAGGTTPWSKVEANLQYTQDGAMAGCFSMRCTEGRVFVRLGSVEVPCPAGGNVTLRDIRGDLRFKAGELGPCPATVCPSLACPDNCSGHGDCVRGRCACWPGWVSENCGQSQ